MDPELNGTSFASVACSESDGGGVCHLCVAALERGLGCGWCHDIARCTKRTQCQVRKLSSLVLHSKYSSVSIPSNISILLASEICVSKYWKVPPNRWCVLVD